MVGGPDTLQLQFTWRGQEGSTPTSSQVFSYEYHFWSKNCHMTVVRSSWHISPTVLAKMWRLVGCSRKISNLFFFTSFFLQRWCKSFQNMYDKLWAEVDRLPRKFNFVQENKKWTKMMDNLSDILTLECAGLQTDDTRSTFGLFFTSLGYNGSN